MPLETVTLGTATDIGVTLLDPAGTAINDLTVSDITVQIRKPGQTAFSTKTVLVGEWSEVGDGVYLLTFTAGELSSVGTFRVLITGVKFARHERDFLIVDEYQTLSTQFIALSTVLAKKANIADTNTLFNVAELRLQELERRLREVRLRLNIAEGMLGALHT